MDHSAIIPSSHNSNKRTPQLRSNAQFVLLGKDGVRYLQPGDSIGEIDPAKQKVVNDKAAVRLGGNGIYTMLEGVRQKK